MPIFGTVSSGNTLGFKNLVINGGFDIWQRGTSGSSAGSFVADRWTINSNSTTHARSSDVPTGFRYSLLMTATSASNAQVTQKIESLNCNGLVGEPITLSFWAKSTSGSTQLGTYISHCNSENDFGSTTTVGSGFFTLTTTWTRYSMRLTSSAPAGILNGIQLGLFRSGTESSTTFITGVQLEDSSVATPFEFKPYSTELQLCKRYYRIAKWRWQAQSPGLGVGQGWTWVFDPEMRTTPSITTSNFTNGSSYTLAGPQGGDSMGMYAVGDGNGTVILHTAASAEL